MPGRRWGRGPWPGGGGGGNPPLKLLLTCLKRQDHKGRRIPVRFADTADPYKVPPCIFDPIAYLETPFCSLYKAASPPPPTHPTPPPPTHPPPPHPPPHPKAPRALWGDSEAIPNGQPFRMDCLFLVEGLEGARPS